MCVVFVFTFHILFFLFISLDSNINRTFITILVGVFSFFGIRLQSTNSEKDREQIESIFGKKKKKLFPRQTIKKKKIKLVLRLAEKCCLWHYGVYRNITIHDLFETLTEKFIYASQHRLECSIFQLSGEYKLLCSLFIRVSILRISPFLGDDGSVFTFILNTKDVLSNLWKQFSITSYTNVHWIEYFRLLKFFFFNTICVLIIVKHVQIFQWFFFSFAFSFHPA